MLHLARIHVREWQGRYMRIMTLKQRTHNRLQKFSNQLNTTDKGALPFFVAIFIIGLVIPLLINLGTIRLSVYRIILLLAFLPALYLFLRGRAGRIRLPDLCVFVFSLWSAVSVIFLHRWVGLFDWCGILWL